MAQARTSWTGVGFGLAIASLAAYHQFKLPPALPVMLEAYAYDRVLAGGFMSIFALAGIALSLRVGRGLARHGLWPYLAAALGLFVAGQALALAAPANGWVMLLARALEGVGFAVCAVAGPLIANLNAAGGHLPLIAGLTASWIPIGQVSASLISLPVVAAGAWRPLWWAGIALTVALGLWSLRLRRDARVDSELRHRRHGAQATLTAGQRRALTLTAAVFGIWSGQYFGYMTWLPQYLVEVYGFQAENAAVAYIVPSTLVIVFCLITGGLLRAGVPLAPLFAGSVFVQVAVWFTVPLAGAGLLGTVSLVVYGAMAGVTPACLFALPSTIVGSGRMPASAFGIIMTGRNLGVLAGPVALAQAVALAADWTLVWPVFGGATLVCALGASYIGVGLRRLTAARGT